MKPSYLLINIALVAGGLLLYHTLVGTPEAHHSARAYDHLQADSLQPGNLGDVPDDYNPAPVVLDGGAGSALARRNAERLSSLESLLAKLSRRADGDTSSAEIGVAPDAALPSLSADDALGTGDTPVFDDRTLRSLEIYMDEINRRKQEENNRQRIDGELQRLGAELDADQRAAVVSATLSFQKKAGELMRQGWSRDDAGREQRRVAFDQLREEYTSTLNTLVPASEAEKIAGSRIVRGLGFFSPGDNSQRRRVTGGGRGEGRGDR
ncbi:MAG: hypothetical protein O2894_02945 [Planctomycetota bacterium]|nr:hypothetical protein [Planctomycetota bacterium]